jgi:6-phosphogluconolactonase (cycloisomerase 2 family)
MKGGMRGTSATARGPRTRGFVLPLCALALACLGTGCKLKVIVPIQVESDASTSTASDVTPTVSDSYYLLSPNGTAGTAATLAYDHDTGQLTPSTSVSLSNPGGSSDVIAHALSHDGRFYYAVSSDGGAHQVIHGYAVDQTDGSLTEMAQSPWYLAAWGGYGNYLEIDPQDRFLFTVAYTNPGRVMGYSIDPTDGSLNPLAGYPFDMTEGGTKAAATQPGEMVFQPTQDRLYVIHKFLPGVSVYDVDPTTGTLTSISGSPFTFASASGTWTSHLRITPDGKFLYVSGGGNGPDSFGIFSLGPTGAPSEVAWGMAALPGMGTSTEDLIDLDPTGRNLLVHPLASTRLYSYAIDASTGLLTLNSGSYFTAAGNLPVSFDEGGRRLFFADAAGSRIRVYAFDPTTGTVGAELATSPYNLGSDIAAAPLLLKLSH